MCNLKNLYNTKIKKKIYINLKYKSIMQVPKLSKIILNMGIGNNNKNNLENALNDLTKIASQKPILTKARKSIAGFKIRKGTPIGCKVTLRKNKMWIFYEKLIFIAIPRIRDFRGYKIKSFDKFGNYNLGIKEHIIFPEIDYKVLPQMRGLNINICTTSRNIKEAIILLSMLKFPFKK